MLSNGKNFISVAPYEVIFAGIAIVFTVLAFNTFGDGIRDYLDPKQNQ
jgi:peptide/nickel transport system permease protein